MREFYAIFCAILFYMSCGDYGYANEVSQDRQQSDKVSERKRHNDDKRNATANRAEAREKFLSNFKSTFGCGTDDDTAVESDTEILSRQINSFGAYDKVLSSYLGVFGKKLPSSKQKVSERTEKLVRPLIKFMQALVSGKAKDSYSELEKITLELQKSSYLFEEFTEALDKHKIDELKYIASGLQNSIPLLEKFVKSVEACKTDKLDSVISEFQKKERRLLHNEFVYLALAKAKELLDTKYDLLPLALRSLAKRAGVRTGELIDRRGRLIQERQAIKQLRNFEAKLLGGNVNVDEWDSHKKSIEEIILVYLGKFEASEGCYVRKELVSIKESLRSSGKMNQEITKFVQYLDDLIETIDLIIPVIESVSDENFFYALGMKQGLRMLGQRKDFLKDNKLAKEILKEINTELGRYSDGSDEFWDLKSEFRKLIEEICGIKYVFGK